MGVSTRFCTRAANLRIPSLLFILSVILSCAGPRLAFAQSDPCPQGILGSGSKENPPDITISKNCIASGASYFYGNVNIIKGGQLIFSEPASPAPMDFWARSIIVENGGLLQAVGPSVAHKVLPFGENGAALTVHLYGPDQSNGDPTKTPGMGAPCKTPENATTGPCGIPMSAWGGEKGNGKAEVDLPGGVHDFFYRYGPLHGDEKCSDGGKWESDKAHRCDERSDPNTPASVKVGYFGYKVLGVSYGGRIELRGLVGRCYEGTNNRPIDRCRETWGRLASSVSPGDGPEGTKGIAIDTSAGGPFISEHDQIVVTTTDYLPGHSETFTVTKVAERTGVTLVYVDHPARFPHNGTRYSLVDRLKASNGRLEASMDPDLVRGGAETRAAVGILNRSVRIVSGGDSPGEGFPDSPASDGTKCKVDKDGKTDGKGPCYSFGGHMVIRQGFESVFLQGVEFKQMGQGGRLAHYPIHFHMARKTPDNTFITQNSINESMTRWIVLHSTSHVFVADNIGYKSIGHGFYLEDATETGNVISGNLGVFARAAINNDQNPRKIAGILSDNQDPKSFHPPDAPNGGFPYRSDSEYPSVFWITNGWNSFIGNMAAGAGTCGACYWVVPAANSSMADVPDDNGNAEMKWSGYAALQKDETFAGTTPLKSFTGNFCTSAMMSFQTTPDAPACDGTLAALAPNPNFPAVHDLTSLAPPPARHKIVDHMAPDPMADMYYPHVIGARKATRCKFIGPGQDAYDCTGASVCSTGDVSACVVTVIDHYTSSFNWAAGAVSAVWLRPFWYLVDNSVLTDVQNAALTFVSGGDFTHSSVIPGYWALVRNSIFVGHTQDKKTGNPYAADSGPFNSRSGLKCDPLMPRQGAPGYCLSTPEGVSLPVANWFINQRLFSIYDGPAFEDANAYLDITQTDCAQGYNNGCIYGSGNALGVPKTPGTNNCYLPNAAIAWKQPNGFFYPPAFHSENLFFNNVDIRHYVIDPLFLDNTYKTNGAAAQSDYCFANDQMFTGFSGIDRQTELNDDDGSLTGLRQTISVNEDSFFNAPTETPECRSNIGPNSDPVNACQLPDPKKPPVTAKTSPYDYVTTVIYHPQMSVDEEGGKKEIWSVDCANPGCYGVPLFRQYLTGVNTGSVSNANTREWAKWYQPITKNGQKVKGDCSQEPNTIGCRWPFIRMAGTATATRETMTVNGGEYYIDTTIPRDMQRDEDFNNQGGRKSITSSFNVFWPGEKYTVFFLYLKHETFQKYQIYVGRDFADNALTAVQVKIPNAAFEINPIDHPNWLKIDRSAVKTTGILTVTLDLKSSDAELLKPSAANGLCQPLDFCKPLGKDGCEGNVSESDPRFLALNGDIHYGPTEALNICSEWAIKDLDCPPSGCLGFQFMLPASFTADATPAAPSPHRPKPEIFPTLYENGAHPAEFSRTAGAPDDKPGGACYYPHLPKGSKPIAADQCLVP